MKLSAALVVLAAASSLPVCAQNGAVQPQSPATSTLPTLRTGTQLVILDVTVTDQNHRPIHNLKAEDFTVLENSTSQTVKTFEEHTTPTVADLDKIEPMPKMPPGVFTNFTPSPALSKGPVNVLLIDRLNTPMQDQARLRTDLINYLKRIKAGTRIAIFGLNTQLVLLQGFTTDPALLRATLEHKGNPQLSPLMDPARATNGAVEQVSDMMDVAAATGTDGSLMTQEIATMSAYTKLFEAAEQSQQIVDRSKRTLEAMNGLARYLVNIPGRKNLIWFSGSFPLELLPDTKIDDQLTAIPIKGAFLNINRTDAEYRETLSLLSRAEIAVYPVDARGLTVLPNTTVAGEEGGGDRYLPFNRGATVTAGTDLLVSDIDTAMANTFDENNTMRSIAYESGGRAFLNSNDLSGAMAEALADGSSYYTLTYSPTNNNWRGDFRKIEIQLRERGYNLSYRRGYYADSLLAPPSAMDRLGSGRAVTGPLDVPDFSPMHLALMHAGPSPTDIIFTVKVVPMGQFTEDKLVPGNEGSRNLKPPFWRYGLNFGADARNISFSRTSDGVRHGNVEFVAFVYDSQGNLVNALGTPAKIDLPSDGVQNVLAHGIPFHEEVSIPYKGQYFVRVVVHDLKSDHVGAVEVPLDPGRDYSKIEALPVKSE